MERRASGQKMPEGTGSEKYHLQSHREIGKFRIILRRPREWIIYPWISLQYLFFYFPLISQVWILIIRNWPIRHSREVSWSRNVPRNCFLGASFLVVSKVTNGTLFQSSVTMAAFRSQRSPSKSQGILADKSVQCSKVHTCVKSTDA